VKTDAQLIHDARNDPDAFAELYRRHAASIHSWFRARAPNQIAGELTAETFAQAALSLKRFRDEASGSAAPWLYGIARNLLRRYLERARVETRARERLGMPIRLDDELEDARERADAARLKPALVPALATLPAAQRRALVLRVVHELSYEEVAAALGCSVTAARLRVMRARGSLSRAMKGAGR
jgi:RNA polymerase sigma-70 factor (ECF subfamily)